MDATDEQCDRLSTCSNQSVSEIRLRLARTKSQQLERRRTLDLEQSKLQYERERVQLNDEIELAELEMELELIEQPVNNRGSELDRCNTDIENASPPYDQPPHHVIVEHTPLRHDTPLPSAPLECGLNQPQQSTPYQSETIRNVNEGLQSGHSAHNTPLNTEQYLSNVGHQNGGSCTVNTNPFYETSYHLPPPVNYVQNMEYYNNGASTYPPTTQYHNSIYPNHIRVAPPLPPDHLQPPGHTSQHGYLPPPSASAATGVQSPTLAVLHGPLPPLAQSPPPGFTPATGLTVPTHQHGDQQSMYQLVVNSLSLPKPEILTFSGDPMDYIRFIHNFETNVSSRLTNPQDKLQYLIQNCEGEAKKAIKDMVVLDPNVGYNEALNTLKELYGRPHIIARSYVEDIVNGGNIKPNDTRALARLGNTMKRCSYTLNTLGYVADLNNSNNLLKIVRRLPLHIKSRWVDRADYIIESGREPSFDDLTTFITARGRVANNIYGQDLSTPDPAYHRQTFKVRKSEGQRITTLTTEGTVTNIDQCAFCDGNHKLWLCEKLKNSSYDERRKFTRSKKLCENCLKFGHVSGRCYRNSFCRLQGCIVKYKHHELLHPPSEKEAANTSAVNCHASVPQGRKVFLRVLPVTVRSKNGATMNIYAMLDECSTTTLCSNRLAKQLGATGKKCKLSLSTVNDTQQLDATDIELQVHALNVPGNPITLDHVLCVNDLPITDIPTASDVADYKHLNNVNITELENKQISLLIGSDYPSAFMETEERKVGQPNEIYAMKTTLGWSIVGPTKGRTQYKACVNYINNNVNCSEQTLHRDLERLWNTDFADIHNDKTAMSVNDRTAIDLLHNQISMDNNNHYIAPLPWKQDPCQLKNNRAMAESRLQSLRNRLDKNEELKSNYCKIMMDYESKGYIQKVPFDDQHSDSKWYLPHHPVINTKKQKVRIVYDAAAKYKGKSLNDHLYHGPDLANSLLGVLLRFRMHRIAIVTDIQEMFLQVKTNDRDSSALRFLWWENGDTSQQPAEYQLLRHAFGLTSSPFVCNYILQHTAEKNKDLFSAETIDTVKRHFYVDDCLKSLQNVDAAKVLISELTELLSLSGFNLHKWLCNIPEVLDNIPKDKRASSVKNFTFSSTDYTSTEKTLGISWNVACDHFMFASVVDDKPHTKRGILSMTSSFYDPIGFFSPVVLTAKLVLQDIARQNVSWDDPVSDDIKIRWLKWLSTLCNISDVKIDRCYVPTDFGQVVRRELHYFCDASTFGYGAVAYMRTIDNRGDIHVSFVVGKSRLAPIKIVTIPRLELSAATLAVRLHTTIMHELQMEIDDIQFWTDSTTVLYYIRNKESRYKTFVANRLAIIHELSSVSQWRYVSTTDNPADHASRGLYGDNETALYMWLHGPTFLKTREDDWPSQPNTLPLITDTEVKVSTHAIVQTQDNNCVQRVLAHFSSWLKIKRILAWLMKYKLWCLNKYLNRNMTINTSDLSVSDLKLAELYAIKTVQQDVFHNEYIALCKGTAIVQSSQIVCLSPIMQDGLLRVGGRLQRAQIPHDSKHQLLLPNKHLITDAIISHAHRNNGHIGINATLAYTREHYWIINAKSAIKRVLSRCITCKRYNAPVRQQIMAPLPVERLQPGNPPFTYVGIDYFGPILVKHRRSRIKRWGCIFTCLTMRAVHIEVAYRLDTDSFLLCLQRFMNRRGQPMKIYSDNGTNFTSAQKELKQCISELNNQKIQRALTQREIEWHFNPPAASHMGGIWERLIRSTRNIMNKLLQEQTVDDEILHTLLTECERIMNDRPLIKPSTDCKDDEALTPSLLLLLKQNSAAPHGIDEKESNYTKRRWRQTQYLSNVFWRRWIRQYLPTLQIRHKWTVVRDNLRVGDIVLLVDERVPRGSWPIARVTATRPDRHGHVRSVEVMSRGSKKIRPITKIVLLEQTDIDQ